MTSILVHYSEIALKGKNRSWFVGRLVRSIHGALAGDAAVRVLVADALGSTDAIAASGRGWQAPVLEELSRDPYAAVRFVAERSLRAVDPHAPPLDPVLVHVLLAARDQRAVTIAE